MQSQSNHSHFSLFSRITQYFLALLVLTACVAGIWVSSRIGVARMLALYGVTTNMMSAVNEATRISPSDPEVHYTHARALLSAGQIPSAVSEFERAVALQPRNYALWSELGGTYDLAGQPDEAIAAVTQAVKLAPYYAQPRWQRGNLLLRKGRRKEAFAEFRLAVNGDASLVPNAVDLAWGAFDGNPQAIEQALQPRTSKARLELARVFALRGAVEDAMQSFWAVTDNSEATGPARDQLQSELLKAKRYYEAWEVWAAGREPGTKAARNGIGIITDGGFEKPVNIAETGFGWRVNSEKPVVAVSLDSHDPFTNTTSLQIRWEGKSSSSVYTAWQIVLVEPNKHYRLSFAARTKDLVSGGLPEVVVLNDFEGHAIAAAAIPQGTTPWQNYALEFTSPPTNQIVYVVIRRKSCPVLSCPAFGIAWFDAFTLQAGS